MTSVSNSAIASLIRTGILDSPNPGNSITMAPMRANTSMKAAASAGSSEISIRMIYAQCGGFDIRIQDNSASTANDSRRYPHHVAVQRVRHERQRQQQGNEDRQDFGHEHQRLFLDLRQRLKQRHHNADDKADDHQRRRHHDDGPDRIARHVEGFSTGHDMYSVRVTPHSGMVRRTRPGISRFRVRASRAPE